ncbi:MAG: His-Xaa-Ser system radical SAM maturase HxsB [Verrucomicrobia bacterium]|nr:His-Xaa-Ser system radical SAM maturase HxsB [Verrucomicrobiota bacterium]
MTSHRISSSKRIRDFHDLLPFRFREIGPDTYLLTDLVGRHLFLSEAEFTTLRDCPAKLQDDTVEKLAGAGLFGENSEESLVSAYRSRSSFLGSAARLHIVVLTLRCDHVCSYCQASRRPTTDRSCDMSLTTAERTVDFILQSPSSSICIEFQGGEPLANFGALQHIVAYAKERKRDKQVEFTVVTNLSMMDEKKLAFLLENDVMICTSLDGPEEIHNRSRVLIDSNSYQNVVEWAQVIHDRNESRERAGRRFSRLNALMTVTKTALNQPKRVVDTYVANRFHSIFLRPLSPFGYGTSASPANAYSAEEFLDFYRRALDYIIELNRRGTLFFERTARVFLAKIIDRLEPNFFDLRSPCGAGIGQLAYNYDGCIFPCDEGRMLSASGDDTFLLGTVLEHTYSDIVKSNTIRQLCVASCLEGLAGCHDCAYHPYCGVCPLYNYVSQGSIFGQTPTNERCEIYRGIQDAVFLRLRENRDVFSSWIKLS